MGQDLVWIKKGVNSMAHFDDIPRGLLQTVAREVADLVDRGLEDRLKGVPTTPGVPPALEIAETLTVWKLKPNTFEALAASALSGDLVDWVVQTPFLYHQISLDKKPTGFARSYLRDARGKTSLFQLNVSDLVAHIDNAIEKIDRKDQHDPVTAANPVVRLLEIPAYHVMALWLFAETLHESRVVIVVATNRYTGLKADSFLSSQEFFAALKDAA